MFSSTESIYGTMARGNHPKYPIVGEICFGLDFNYLHKILEIDVKQCRDIAAVDTKRNISNPYVKNNHFFTWHSLKFCTVQSYLN